MYRRVVAQEMRRVPGIAYAVSRDDFMEGTIPNDPIVKMMARAFHPKRSGDVLIVPDQLWYLDRDPNTYSTMHGSPYSYDTHVPLIIAGAGVRPGKVSRRVSPEDIAPTIARFLGIPAPSGCVGQSLRRGSEPPLR